MPPKTALHSRLEEVMAACGWTQRDLERHSGASRSLVSQWLGHASKPIKSIGNVAVSMRLQEASGYAAAWIARGEGPKMAPTGVQADDPGAQELLRIYGSLNLLDRARLLAFAADLPRKHPRAA